MHQPWPTDHCASARPRDAAAACAIVRSRPPCTAEGRGQILPVEAPQHPVHHLGQIGVRQAARWRRPGTRPRYSRPPGTHRNFATVPARLGAVVVGAVHPAGGSPDNSASSSARRAARLRRPRRRSPPRLRLRAVLRSTAPTVDSAGPMRRRSITPRIATTRRQAQRPARAPAYFCSIATPRMIATVQV